MWCIGQLTAQYRQRMYAVLDLYERPYNPDQPVVCVDEKSKQLLAPKHPTLPVQPGQSCKVDYEYERKGTRNLSSLICLGSVKISKTIFLFPLPTRQLRLSILPAVVVGSVKLDCSCIANITWTLCQIYSVLQVPFCGHHLALTALVRDSLGPPL